MSGSLNRVDQNGTRVVVHIRPTTSTPTDGRYGVTAQYLDPATQTYTATGKWTASGSVTNSDGSMFNDFFNSLVVDGLRELGVYIPPGVQPGTVRLLIQADAGNLTIDFNLP